MTEAHTKGPWELDLGQDDGVFTVRMASAIENNSSYYSNHQLDWKHGVDSTCAAQWEETVATARLIAAAPELLEALKDARKEILFLKNSRSSEAEGSDEDWVSYIDTAIAKAEGRS